MRLLLIFVCAASLWAVNPNRVLLVVNDNTPAETGTSGVNASLWVAQHYISVRGVPSGNIFHISASTAQSSNYTTDYLANIETPLMTYLNASSGAMKHQILYIIPCYGVPLYATGVGTGDGVSVDSLIAGMYNVGLSRGTTGSSHGTNPYSPIVPLQTPYTTLWSPAASQLPFTAFMDQRETTGGSKMFVVARLDALSAVVASALVDKAVAAEAALRPTTGAVSWNWEGTRNSTEYQLWIDTRMRDGAVLTSKKIPLAATTLHKETSANNFPDDLDPIGFTGTLEKTPAGTVTYADMGVLIQATNVMFAFGWYHVAYQGMYSWVPGAVGSHYISGSGVNLRTPGTEIALSSNRWGESWTGRMIEDGITATWGTVAEPADFVSNWYPAGIDFADFFFSGFNFGDSFYLSSPTLRWTCYAVGDPLYQPHGIARQTTATTRNIRIR